MELIIEIFIEIYMSLMMTVVPEKGESSRKYRRIALFVALSVLVCVIGLFLWGAILLADYNNKLGIIPIAVASVISVVQIVLGLILFVRRCKNEDCEKGKENRVFLAFLYPDISVSDTV